MHLTTILNILYFDTLYFTFWREIMYFLLCYIYVVIHSADEVITYKIYAELIKCCLHINQYYPTI